MTRLNNAHIITVLFALLILYSLWLTVASVPKEPGLKK